MTSGGDEQVVATRSALVAAATERLLGTLRAAPDAWDAPSMLPGWTRGHVATHVARNADSFTWMLDGAAADEVREQYPGGAPTRAAAIDAGAARSGADLLADVERSAARFAAACSRVEPGVWSRTVRATTADIPAGQLLWSRLREVEVHHADLGLGFGPADWSAGFVAEELPLRVGGLAVRLPRGTAVRLVAADGTDAWEVGVGPASVTVGGPRALLLGWLMGRDPGSGLQAPAGLPTLAPW